MKIHLKAGSYHLKYLIPCDIYSYIKDFMLRFNKFIRFVTNPLTFINTEKSFAEQQCKNEDVLGKVIDFKIVIKNNNKVESLFFFI